MRIKGFREGRERPDCNRRIARTPRRERLGYGCSERGRRKVTLCLVLAFSLISCAKLKFDNPYDPKNRPTGPQAFSPPDGAILTDNPPQFSWASCGVDTAYYHLQISADSLFAMPIFDNSTLRGTTLGLSSALPYGQLYWRVRAAKAKEAWGPWSARYRFIIQSSRTSAAHQDKPTGLRVINAL